MVGDVVAQVGGQCVEVTTLMGPGVDPHLYRASAGDLRVLQRAEVVFYAGHSLEGRLGEVLDRFGATRPVVAVSEEAVPPSLLLEAEAPYAVDPHVWMDVSLWTRTVDVVRDALAEIQPACAQEFELRAAAYKEQLAALDRWIQDSVASLPRERRVLVTAHDAFHYYGRAYGLEVVAIQGISTEDEAGLADIRAVTDLVVQRGVPAIFVESSINPRNIEAVQAAAKDRGSPVSIGGELFSDALGHAGTWQGTYIGMLVHNTRAIVEGLGGKPAPWPLELADWVKAWGLEDL
ncbi:MAG: zinc ABC transporter substrate-binding protein [Firmicutes bacterium]|nr:zinc ABC transporter substrate-binding protein [Bacillota bacterium]